MTLNRWLLFSALLAVAAGWTEPTPQAPSLPELVSSMQVGQWATLSTTDMVSAFTGSGGSMGVYIPYSSLARFDPVSGTVHFIGSDHVATNATSLRHIVYHVSSNKWTYSTPSYYVPNPYNDSHGYQRTSIDPVSRRLFRNVGASPIRVWNLDSPDSTTGWSDLPAPPEGNYGVYSGEYFPERNSLLYASLSTSLWELNLTNNTWKRIDYDLPVLLAGTWMQMIYNPVLHHVLITDQYSNAMSVLNANGRVTRIFNPLPDGETYRTYNGAGQNGLWVVDPATGKYLLMTDPWNGTGRNVYEFDFTTRRFSFLASQPPNKHISLNTNWLAASLPEYGVTMWIWAQAGSKPDAGVYLYKHGAGVTVPVAAAPTASASAASAPAASAPAASAPAASAAAASAPAASAPAASAPAASAPAASAALMSGAMGPSTDYPAPSLADEKSTYALWKWTWSGDKDSARIRDPKPITRVSDPDIHSGTESDDLWTYLVMYRRTNNPIYLNRAQAWARYFKEDYRACKSASPYLSYCFDKNSYGLDHLYGWGLLELYEAFNDLAAFDEAKALAADLAVMYSPQTPFGCLPRDGCLHYGPRQIGRHLIFATRIAGITKDPAHIALRDNIIRLLTTSPMWDATHGMYFVGEFTTDATVGTGAYAAGARVNSAFSIAILAEAMFKAYRATGNTILKDRLIAMARFVAARGLDSTYQYTGSGFGVRNGQTWHSYSATQPVTFWDPVYTTSLVNVLVMGYKLTGDQTLLDKAKTFFNRGTKGIYGSPTARSAPDNQVAHFVDTQWDSSSGYFYFAHNKGELQYTYLIFENGGQPSIESK